MPPTLVAAKNTTCGILQMKKSEIAVSSCRSISFVSSGDEAISGRDSARFPQRNDTHLNNSDGLAVPKAGLRKSGSSH
jgi:hypothetical protein